MNKISLNVFTLIRDLEKSTGKRWTFDMLAENSRISRPTWARLESSVSPPKRMDFETLESLLDFFQTEGLDITIADLFRVKCIPDDD